MDIKIKEKIIKNLCYTQLVYQRINKKLNTNLTKNKIENLILQILKETSINFFTKKGKNYYIKNKNHNIQITINSNTYRIITVDKI